MTQTVIAIIPARSGSKSIKDKNIKIFRKKPLIYWSIRSCLSSKLIKKIYFSTDSKKYAQIALACGVHEVIYRPKKISKDNSTDYEMIKHAIENIKTHFDVIAHIRPTTPLRSKGIIDQAIRKFLTSRFDSLRTVHEMPETAYKSFEVKKNKLVGLCKTKKTIDDLNAPRQKFKKTFSANGIIDLYKKNFILKNKKLFGKRSMAFITKFTHEIDTLDQFNYLEKLKND